MLSNERASCLNPIRNAIEFIQCIIVIFSFMYNCYTCCQMFWKLLYVRLYFNLILINITRLFSRSFVLQTILSVAVLWLNFIYLTAVSLMDRLIFLISSIKFKECHSIITQHNGYVNAMFYQIWMCSVYESTRLAIYITYMIDLTLSLWWYATYSI